MISIILQAEPGMKDIIMASPVSSFIFAITLATSIWAFSNDNLYGNLVLHPYSVWRKRRIYTILTSGLTHGDYMHLFFNMFTYFFFAFPLERIIGHWQFGVLYVVSLILSDLPTIYKHRDDDRYHSLGASGAVSAVVFSVILFDPFLPMGVMFLPVNIPGIIFGPLYLFYCSYSSRHSNDNINHDAHLFGALSGLLITIVLNPHVVNSFIMQINEGVQSFLHR